jgi:hypothetical protein
MSSFADFPSVPIGLSNNLQYQLPPSVPDAARAYNVAVSPNGITTVTGTALPTAVFVANSGMATSAFNSQMIAFDLPCGQGNTFLDPRETLLNFRLTWVVTTASNSTAGVAQLISSASSFFSTLQLYHNNVPVESIGNYDILSNMLLLSTVNSADRWGGLSIGMGVDTDTFAGIDLPTAATGTYYFNFAIPLVSLLGLNCDKLIPVGFIQSLQLQLTTNPNIPVSTYCTAITTQPVISAPVLDQFTLNMKYIDVGEAAASLLSQTLQDGKWFIKAQTYTGASSTVPSGSSGSTSILYQIRNSSVKSLFISNGIAACAACPNGYFDAVNIAVTSAQISLNGNKYPNRPLNPSHRPAEAYMQLMSAWGAGSSIKSYGGVSYRGSYGATIPSLPTSADNMMVVPAAGLRAMSHSNDATQIVTSYPHGHYLGFDLDRLTGSLFSGLNTRSSPPFLDLTLGVAATSTITSFCWGLIDVVLCVEPSSKSLTAFV